MRLFKNRKGSAAVYAIFVAAVIVAVASVIGLAITSLAKDVFDGMALASAANTAMSNTVATIYTSWPLSGIIVLAMFGAAALGAFVMFRT